MAVVHLLSQETTLKNAKMIPTPSIRAAAFASGRAATRRPSPPPLQKCVTPLPSASIAIVKEVLRTHGPQTTQSLYSLLPPSLPSRPPPRNFLSGLSRSSASPSHKFPGQDTSSDGVWSISYLKKKVLKGMEGRGEIMKVTRGKWAGLVGGKGGLKESAGKKEEESHVWVIGEEWRKASERANAAKEREVAQKREEL